MFSGEPLFMKKKSVDFDTFQSYKNLIKGSRYNVN